MVILVHHRKKLPKSYNGLFVLRCWSCSYCERCQHWTDSGPALARYWHGSIWSSENGAFINCVDFSLQWSLSNTAHKCQNQCVGFPDLHLITGPDCSSKHWLSSQLQSVPKFTYSAELTKLLNDNQAKWCKSQCVGFHDQNLFPGYCDANFSYLIPTVLRFVNRMMS